MWSGLGRAFIQPLAIRSDRPDPQCPGLALRSLRPFRVGSLSWGAPTPSRCLAPADSASARAAGLRASASSCGQVPAGRAEPRALVPCLPRGSAAHAQISRPPRDLHLGAARVLVTHLGAHRSSCCCCCCCWGSVPPFSWSWVAVHVRGSCLVEKDSRSTTDAPRDAKG